MMTREEKQLEVAPSQVRELKLNTDVFMNLLRVSHLHRCVN